MTTQSSKTSGANSGTKDKATKFVLSIDGGGIKGIIPAMVLAYLEERTGKRTAELFDLIVGTSTGGLLGLALSCPTAVGNNSPKYPAEELVKMYVKKGGTIFKKSWRTKIGKFFRLFHKYMYCHKGLEGVLRKYFSKDGGGGDGVCCECENDATCKCDDQYIMDDAIKKVMVTAYDTENREPVFLKSWDGRYKHITMLDAARATSAGPTYFRPMQVRLKKEVGDGHVFESMKRTLIDGGVFINHPAMSAYTQELSLLKKRECEDKKKGCDDKERECEDKKIFVLSLGTGKINRPYPYETAKSGYGTKYWGVEWLVDIGRDIKLWRVVMGALLLLAIPAIALWDHSGVILWHAINGIKILVFFGLLWMAGAAMTNWVKNRWCKEPEKKWGKEVSSPLISCMFDGVDDATSYHLRQTLGDRYMRLQTPLDGASDDLDEVDPHNIEKLLGLSKKLITDSSGELDCLVKLICKKCECSEAADHDAAMKHIKDLVAGLKELAGKNVAKATLWQRICKTVILLVALSLAVKLGYDLYKGFACLKADCKVECAMVCKADAQTGTNAR